MSSDDFVYFVPKELAIGELDHGELAADAPEVAQDAPGDADLSEFEQILDIVHVTETHEVSQQFTVCLQTALSDPLLAEAGVADYCIEQVGVGGTSTTTAPHLVVAEDPPNPVLPATNEIFWSAIFFLLLWGLMKYVLLPPIRKLQAQRAQKLQDDRDAAQQAEEDLARAQADYDAAFQAAREEANVLLDEARTRASDRRAELVGAAVSDVSASRAAATREMSAARSEAVGNLRSEIRELAVDAASNVLGTRPSDTAAADRAIDELLEEALQRETMPQEIQPQGQGQQAQEGGQTDGDSGTNSGSPDSDNAGSGSPDSASTDSVSTDSGSTNSGGSD